MGKYCESTYGDVHNEDQHPLTFSAVSRWSGWGRPGGGAKRGFKSLGV